MLSRLLTSISLMLAVLLAVSFCGPAEQAESVEGKITKTADGPDYLVAKVNAEIACVKAGIIQLIGQDTYAANEQGIANVFWGGMNSQNVHNWLEVDDQAKSEGESGVSVTVTATLNLADIKNQLAGRGINLAGSDTPWNYKVSGTGVAEDHIRGKTLAEMDALKKGLLRLIGQKAFDDNEASINNIFWGGMNNQSVHKWLEVDTDAQSQVSEGVSVTVAATLNMEDIKEQLSSMDLAIIE